MKNADNQPLATSGRPRQSGRPRLIASTKATGCCSRDGESREGLVAQRATILARIGAAGQRALVPVDPDRLAAAERADHAGGLVADLLETLDDLGRHAVLALVEALIMQAARHIDGFQ